MSMIENTRGALPTFKPGDIFRVHRQITNEQIRSAVELTGDRGRWHHDEAFARSCGFDGIIAPGLLTASLVTEFGGSIDYLATTMTFQFLAPVHGGDRLTATIQVESFDPVSHRLSCTFVVERAGDGKPVIRGHTEGFQGGAPKMRAGASRSP